MQGASDEGVEDDVASGGRVVATVSAVTAPGAPAGTAAPSVAEAGAGAGVSGEGPYCTWQSPASPIARTAAVGGIAPGAGGKT
ncbi:hypothetical protein GCM10010389_32740 [Streptomyces echinoruber]|uniref:Uncharacterized protein n=1 Tax=Streptomyces echinoruber TaxID=68898 RepID=A0A918VDU7_9ACTN|nr:hypothetical protein GCM10010389_32740 [Streptomyces echinoruber]